MWMYIDWQQRLRLNKFRKKWKMISIRTHQISLLQFVHTLKSINSPHRFPTLFAFSVRAALDRLNGPRETRRSDFRRSENELLNFCSNSRLLRGSHSTFALETLLFLVNFSLQINFRVSTCISIRSRWISLLPFSVFANYVNFGDYFAIILFPHPSIRYWATIDFKRYMSSICIIIVFILFCSLVIKILPSIISHVPIDIISQNRINDLLKQKNHWISTEYTR